MHHLIMNTVIVVQIVYLSVQLIQFGQNIPNHKLVKSSIQNLISSPTYFCRINSINKSQPLLVNTEYSSLQFSILSYFQSQTSQLMKSLSCMYQYTLTELSFVQVLHSEHKNFLDRSKIKEMEIQLPPIHPSQAFLTTDDLSNQAEKNVRRLMGCNINQTYQKVQYASKLQHLYISPLGRFCLIYNLFYMLIFYIMQVHFTLTMTFGLYFLSSELSNELFTDYYWIIVAFFQLDIFLTFSKGYYHKEKGIVVEDYTKIFRNYVRFQFWVDLISLIFMIFPYLVEQQEGEFMMIVPVILMWIKKFKIRREVIHAIQHNKNQRNLFILIVLASDFLLIGHYGACLFLKIELILKSENYYGPHKRYYWFEKNDPYKFTDYQGHWYLYYLYAQSFSTGTLSTIAPGPFAKNPISVVFSIAFTLFCVLFTSYVAEILIEIIQTHQQQRDIYQDKIEVFGNYLRYKKVTLKLQVDIYNYFQILKEFHIRSHQKQEEALFAFLPNTLRKQLSLELSFVKKLTIFQSFNHSNALVSELSLKLKRKILGSETQFFSQLQINDTQSMQTQKICKSINFLVSGVLKYYIKLNGSCIDHMKNKQHILGLSNVDKFIGFYQFFTGQGMNYYCKTIDLCQINFISKEDFNQAVKLTKNESNLHRLKNQVLIENKINLINKVCLICLSSQHAESHCPEIMISKKFFNRLFKSSGYSLQQQRNSKFKRASVKYIHHKALKKTCNQDFIQIRKNRNLSIGKNIIDKIMKQTKRGVLNQQRQVKIEAFQVHNTWSDFYPEFNLISFG